MSKDRPCVQEGKVYFAETRRINVRQIINNLSSYTCSLEQAEDGSESFLVFHNRTNKTVLRYSLQQFQPISKATCTFTETADSVEYGTKVNERCMMYPVAANKKSRHEFLQEDAEVGNIELSFNQNKKEKEVFKGTMSNDPNFKRTIKENVLKLLEEVPQGNTNPSNIRQLLKQRFNEEVTEKFTREVMEDLCEPAERNNKKYIIKKQYRSNQLETDRKKFKPN